MIRAANTLVASSPSARSGWSRLDGFARQQAICVALIGFMAFAGSALVGAIAGIPEPQATDEFSYLLAADTFAHGRLTNPTHPMWTHLESGHIIHQPTYMSKYPPAQGLALAAGQIIAGHPVLGVWMSFGLMCAAISWMLYAWVPPRWAVFGGFFAAINPLLGITGYWAQSYWGGAVAATGGALVFGAVRRIPPKPSVHNACLMGLGVVILANSRPYEGFLVSLPAVVMLFIWILRHRGLQLWNYIGRIITPLLVVLVVTGAGLAVYNLRITGDALCMPYQAYTETYEIAPKFIWESLRPEPVFRHESMRAASYGSDFKLYNLERTVVGFLTKNLATLSWWLLYSLNVFIIPLIVALPTTVRWAQRHQWARFALLIYGVFILGIFLEVPTMIHYWAPIIGFNYFFVLQAMRLSKWRNANRNFRQLGLGLVVLLTAVALVASLYIRLNSNNPGEWYRRRAAILRELTKAEGQHLIVVSYGPNHATHKEWVYNEADIDTAKVIWARSMDPAQNCKLVKYFHQRQIWTLHIDKDHAIPGLKPYLMAACQ